jgi:hypothetical protein
MASSTGIRRALLKRGEADASYDLPNGDLVTLTIDGKLTTAALRKAPTSTSPAC